MADDPGGQELPAAPDAASPPDASFEQDVLKAEIEALAPALTKADSAATLSPLLRIIERARSMGADGFPLLKGFARTLRQNRAFDDLYILASNMRSTGMADLDVRRWEIQALIELGVFETALELSRPLLAAGPETREGEDGYSAVGRVYKQMYIDARAGRTRLEPVLAEEYLRRSYAAYLLVWRAATAVNVEANAYYGVNALAMAARAERDGIALPGPGPASLATDVLSAVALPTQVWSWATRGEALIAQGKHREAAQAYAAFALSPEVDVFQLHASLRQLEEVWQLSGDMPEAGASIRLIKAILMGKLASSHSKTDPVGTEVQLSGQEARAIGAETPQLLSAAKDNYQTTSRGDPKGLEQIFSVNAPVALQVVRNALQRARSICRIHANMGGQDTPFGTGFAIRGSLLNPAWGDDPVIVTNNHVISTAAVGNSQRMEYCDAVFVCQDTDACKRVGFKAVLWESDPEAHDITILALDGPLPGDAEPLAALALPALPRKAVNDDGIGRLYVIGFPAAGQLSFSFADNIFLDHDGPEITDLTSESAGEKRVQVQPEPVRLHYKTPTLGGSSGSPVFDFNSFQLIGVHHRGLPGMPRLNRRAGTYAANQGVWIESIRAAIAESESAEAATSGPRRWRSRPAPPPAAASDGPAPDPILAAPLSGGAAPAGPRIWPGAIGEAVAGASPVAAQVLKAGRASPEDIARVGHESIVGADDRTRIFDTGMSPWRMICAIRCWWGSRLAVGTGFLVSPGLLLTAGHVVYPKNFRTLPDRIEVIPGLNAIERPFGDAKVHSVSVHPGWQTRFDLTTDVAAIHLGEGLGRKVGWFAVASRSPEELRSSWSHVTGYPGEKLETPVDPKSGVALAPVKAAQLWHHATPILNVQHNRVFYATDTTGGQSGAPIYILDPEVSPTPVVVGVHAYGAAASPVSIGESNSGAWINDALFDIIAQWRDLSDQILKDQHQA